MSFYRAKLTLEYVEPYKDSNGYTREQSSDTASFVVTGETPSEAMDQMRNHVAQLQKWHAATPAEQIEATR